MKTKKKKSHVNNYKPVRVVNPTAAWHTTRLYPCQSMVLKLRKPRMFLSATNETAEFDVSLHSDFLIVEVVEFDEETGDKVYVINQKFDFTNWAEYGEVLLGEINIKLINNTHENKDKQNYNCNICVILHSPRNDVITVVNPASHSVKLEPHQLLEVVCYEPSWNNGTETKSSAGLRDEWDYQDNNLVANKNNLKLKNVKYDIAGDHSCILTRDESQFAIKNRFDFKVNPRLAAIGRAIVDQEISGIGKPIREHHWWFACDESTLKKVVDISNGIYPACTLDFDGKCREDGEDIHYTATRSLDVLFAVHGKNKHKMHPYYLNPDSVEHKMELVKRVEDRYKQVLTNPLSAEQVDFHLGYETVVLEVVQPNCLWSDLDDSVEWKFTVDNNHLAPKHVKITPQQSYRRWGKLFQRVRIDHDYVPANAVETKFLGAVYITCEPKKDAHDGNKRISFWLTPNERKTATYSTWSKSPSTMNSNSTSGSLSSGFYGGNSYNQNGSKKKEKEYRTPQVAVLEINEINCDNELRHEGDSLKTRIVSEVWIGNKNYHHSYCGNDFCKIEPKKKETNSMSDCPSRSYRATSGTRNASEDDSSAKEGGTSGIKTGTKITDVESVPGDRPAFIVYNPDHLNKINLEYGQKLIVRMSVPQKLYAGKCEGEQWSLSWDSGANNGLQVTQFKTVTVGDSFYQEVKVRLERVPVVPGIHPVGCLRFHCSEVTRVVFVQVKVKNGDNVERPEIVIPAMRVVPPTRCFDGVESRKLYVSEWLHNDAIAVKPMETFYLRNPAHISGWKPGGWVMEIEQYPLPDEVWKHELVQDVLRDIDLDNPWFATSHPLQLATTYIFRPLAMQQPHIVRILRAAAEVLKDDYLAIARVTFRNSHHPLNSRLVTAVGVLGTEYKMERSLGIVVDLLPYRPKELVLVNPNHKEEFSVFGDEMLTIKLSPRFMEVERVGLVKAPWFIGPYPQFLDFKEPIKVNGDQVFQFKVRGDYPENRNEWLKFICGNTEKMLLAKYEKKK